MSKRMFGRMLAQAGEVIRSRSSALIPLQWKIAIFVAAILVLTITKAPMWIEICFMALIGLVTIQSMFSYDYFMKKDPGSLRSEKHAITKYAIDKGLYGDSDVGTRPLAEIEEQLLISGNLGGERRLGVISVPPEGSSE